MSTQRRAAGWDSQPYQHPVSTPIRVNSCNPCLPGSVWTHHSSIPVSFPPCRCGPGFGTLPTTPNGAETTTWSESCNFQ